MQLDPRRISSCEVKMPDRRGPNLELTGEICEAATPAQRPAFLHDVSPH